MFTEFKKPQELKSEVYTVKRGKEVMRIVCLQEFRAKEMTRVEEARSLAFDSEKITKDAAIAKSKGLEFKTTPENVAKYMRHGHSQIDYQTILLQAIIIEWEFGTEDGRMLPINKESIQATLTVDEMTEIITLSGIQKQEEELESEEGLDGSKKAE